MSEQTRWYSDSMKDAAHQMSFSDRLDAATALWKKLRSEQLTVESHADDVTRLVALLDDLHLAVPDIKAWCVVKHYYDHVPGGAWEPKVWCACHTQEQAEDFVPKIQAHYNFGRPNRKNYDVFKVEWRLASVTDLVPPAMTGAEYVALLPR